MKSSLPAEGANRQETRSESYEHGGSEGTGHRGLQGSGSHRVAGQGGGPERGGPVFGDGRVGQGEHGDPDERGRGGQGDPSQAGGQGGGRKPAAAGRGDRCNAGSCAALLIGGCAATRSSLRP